MSEKKKKTSGKFRKVVKSIRSATYGKLGGASTSGGITADVSFPAAMKQTGKSMGFIYRCINDGRLPAFKVARATVFRQSDIDKLMTPVPYTPTAERSYAKNVKPKLGVKKPGAKKNRSKRLSAKAAGKARKKAGEPRKRAPSLKATVTKALEGMSTDVPEAA